MSGRMCNGFRENREAILVLESTQFSPDVKWSPNCLFHIPSRLKSPCPPNLHCLIKAPRGDASAIGRPGYCTHNIEMLMIGVEERSQRNRSRGMGKTGGRRQEECSCGHQPDQTTTCCRQSCQP